MDILYIVFFVVFGAVMGSFCCCQAWRVRYKEEGKKDLGKRSVCLRCKKQLKWYENIPIVSWLAQGGKCRSCGEKIGNVEIWTELAGATVFGLLGWSFLKQAPYDWLSIVRFGILSIMMVGLLFLAIYDAKWRELPTTILWFVIICGGVYAVVTGLGIGAKGVESLAVGRMFDLDGAASYFLGILAAVGILGGIYYLLYFFSKEKLVGGGDWMLGVAISLVLGDWWLAVWTLFLANFVGAIVMIPQKKKKIAFGPFLFGAFVVVLVFSEFFLGMK